MALVVRSQLRRLSKNGGAHVPRSNEAVLLGLSEVLPEAGHNVLTGVDMRTGWGETILVTVRSGIPRHENQGGGRSEVQDGGRCCSRGCSAPDPGQMG